MDNERTPHNAASFVMGEKHANCSHYLIYKDGESMDKRFNPRPIHRLAYGEILAAIKTGTLPGDISRLRTAPGQQPRDLCLSFCKRLYACLSSINIVFPTHSRVMNRVRSQDAPLSISPTRAGVHGRVVPFSFPKMGFPPTHVVVRQFCYSFLCRF